MLQVAKEDMAIERQTYETNRVGLDTMYADAQKQLKTETQIRMVRLMLIKAKSCKNHHL